MDVLTQLSDVPVDPTPAADVVDKADSEKPQEIIPVTAKSVAAPLVTHFVVPFHRAISLGTKGKDTIGAKRAVWAALDLKVPKGAQPVFGQTAVNHLKEFQKTHGLHTDGVLGESTLAKLGPYFDQYAFLLYEGFPPSANATVQKRNAFVAYMLWGYNNRGSIHYAQQRPMDHLNDLHFLPVWDDCSEWFTKGCKYAGMKDPNKQSPPYNGSGWTGTLGANGKKVTIAQALPADAVLYGTRPDFEHVAGYIGGKRVISHGSEGGPFLLAYDYRTVAEIRSYL